MVVTAPNIQEIKAYFSKAKEVLCLDMGIPVGVCNLASFTFNEAEQAWKGPAGTVTFWKGGYYAEILRTKCAAPGEKCSECAKKKLKKQ